MSAFAVIFERSNTPVDPGVLERVMQRMSHRGPDGSDVCLANQLAFGHWHFWTTPEELGERQPLVLPGKPFKVVMDGRIDNRDELMRVLDIHSSESQRFSDAALIIQAYERWGERCFEHFIGEYGLVIWDELRSELLCARDVMGDRTLFYTMDSTRVVIASEPWAVAGAINGDTPVLDETRTAYYFAMQVPEDGRTLFKNIFELLPAQVLAITASSERYWYYWRPNLSTKIRYSSDVEYAEHFISVLDESVSCRMRATTSIGVMMSGGLDSTSVASLAARRLAPEPLVTISYIFDELQDCDERGYIEKVVEKLDLNSILIPCDDAWPFKDLQYGPEDKNYPPVNIFRLLRERVYDRAQQEELRVLLTGGFADHIYQAGVNWLAALISERRIYKALQEISSNIFYLGVRRFLRQGSLQHAGRYLIGKLPGNISLRSDSEIPAWLSLEASNYLSEAVRKDESALAWRRNISAYSMSNAHSSSGEIFYASHHDLEIRRPYRDRRLIEFALAIPPDQLYRRGLYKHVLRNAMQGILPEEVRTRSSRTGLTMLFSRGIEREEKNLHALIYNSDAAWRRFIRPDWFANHAFVDAPPYGLIPWLCLSYEIWNNSIQSTET